MPNYYRDRDVECDGRRNSDDDRYEDYKRIYSDRERHNRGFPNRDAEEAHSWLSNHSSNQGDEHSVVEHADKWSECRRNWAFTRRGPRGYRRSDRSIRKDVGEYLEWHGRIDAMQIQVSVDDGEVTLSGIVGTREEKRLAEGVAKACLGVKEVHNKLCVNRANWNQGDTQKALGELSQ